MLITCYFNLLRTCWSQLFYIVIAREIQVLTHFKHCIRVLTHCKHYVSYQCNNVNRIWLNNELWKNLKSNCRKDKTYPGLNVFSSTHFTTRHRHRHRQVIFNVMFPSLPRFISGLLINISPCTLYTTLCTFLYPYYILYRYEPHV